MGRRIKKWRNRNSGLNFEIQEPDFCTDHSAAHESFQTKTKDKLILKITISLELFHHVDTINLIQKLIDFARKADLDEKTLLEEQLIDHLLQIFRNRIKISRNRPQKKPGINQSKDLLSYYNKFEQLVVELDTDLPCYKEPIQDTCQDETKICVPFFFTILCFSP